MEMPVNIAPLHDELGILVHVSAAGPWKDDVDLIHESSLLFEASLALTEAADRCSATGESVRSATLGRGALGRRAGIKRLSARPPETHHSGPRPKNRFLDGIKSYPEATRLPPTVSSE